MKPELHVGPLKIQYMGETTTESITMSGEQVEASQHLAFITGPDGIALETAYLNFVDTSRDVRVIEIGDTPSPYSRLGHGGRMGVYTLGDKCFSETRAMKLGLENWSNLQRATFGEIESWLGSSLNDFLELIGCSEVRTRSELFGDTGRRRNELACTFQTENYMAAFGLFTLTRPLPLLRGARK